MSTTTTTTKKADGCVVDAAWLVELRAAGPAASPPLQAALQAMHVALTDGSAAKATTQTVAALRDTDCAGPAFATLVSVLLAAAPASTGGLRRAFNANLQVLASKHAVATAHAAGPVFANVIASLSVGPSEAPFLLLKNIVEHHASVALGLWTGPHAAAGLSAVLQSCASPTPGFIETLLPIRVLTQAVQRVPKPVLADKAVQISAYAAHSLADTEPEEKSFAACLLVATLLQRLLEESATAAARAVVAFFMSPTPLALDSGELALPPSMVLPAAASSLLGRFVRTRAIIFGCSPATLAASLGASSDTLLRLHVLPVLLDALAHSSTDVHLHLHATVALHGAVEKIRAAILEGHAHVRDVLPSETLDPLVDALCVALTHSTEAVRTEGAGILKTLLPTVTAIPGDNPIVTRVARLPWHLKGRYSLLAAVVKCNGANFVLAQLPSLPSQIIDCMGIHSIAQAAGNFMEELLVSARAEWAGALAPADNLESALTERWARLFLEPIAKLLLSDNSQSKFQAGFYCLPGTLKVFPGAARVLISHFDSERKREHPRALEATMAILKHARMMTGAGSQDISKLVAPDVLRDASCHADERVQVDALLILCGSGKLQAPVTEFEFELYRELLGQVLDLSQSVLRDSVAKANENMLTRLRDEWALSCTKLKQLERKMAKMDVDADLAQLDHFAGLLNGCETACNEMTYKTAYMATWLRDLAAMNLYTGASFQRLTTALDLLAAVARVFPPHAPEKWPAGFSGALTPAVLQSLLLALQQPHAALQQQIIALLLTADTAQWALVFTGPAQVSDALAEDDVPCFTNVALAGWQLSASPRQRDAAAGAVLLKLVFAVAVQKLHWRFKIEGAALERAQVSSLSTAAVAADAAAPDFVVLLVTALEASTRLAQENAPLAARTQPMFGIILALDALWDLVPPTDIIKVAAWNDVVVQLLEALFGAMEQGLAVLQDARASNDMAAAFVGDHDGDIDGDNDENDAGVVGPLDGATDTAQFVHGMAWHTLQHGATLLQHVLSTIVGLSSQQNKLVSIALVDRAGALFRKILLGCQHRGVIDSAALNLREFVATLLTCPDKALAGLPALWLQSSLSEGVLPSAQSITRRAAGFPGLVRSLLTSSSSFAAFEMLMSVAETPLHAASSGDEHRDLPQVRAINVLREMFKETRLREAMLRGAGRGFVLAVNGFASPVWAIRNACTLLLGSLTRRMFGGKTTANDSSGEMALSAREFFQRFPETEPFLLHELRQCVENRGALQPQVFAALSVLGRLGPVPDPNFADQARASQFSPLLEALTANCVEAVRRLAARALVPFLAPPMSDGRGNALHPVLDRLVRLSEHNSESLTHNALHGQLLVGQMWLADLQLSHQSWAQQFVAAATAVLQPLAWLGAASTMACPTVRHAFWALWAGLRAPAGPHAWAALAAAWPSSGAPDELRLQQSLLDVVAPAAAQKWDSALHLCHLVAATKDNNAIAHFCGLVLANWFADMPNDFASKLHAWVASTWVAALDDKTWQSAAWWAEVLVGLVQQFPALRTDSAAMGCKLGRVALAHLASPCQRLREQCLLLAAAYGPHNAPADRAWLDQLRIALAYGATFEHKSSALRGIATNGAKHDQVAIFSLLVHALQDHDAEVRELAASVVSTVIARGALSVGEALRRCILQMASSLPALFSLVAPSTPFEKCFAPAGPFALFDTEDFNQHFEPVRQAHMAAPILADALGAAIAATPASADPDLAAYLQEEANRHVRAVARACQAFRARSSAVLLAGTTKDQCAFVYQSTLALSLCVRALCVLRAAEAPTHWRDAPLAVALVPGLAEVLSDFGELDSSAVPLVWQMLMHQLALACFYGHPAGPAEVVRRQALLTTAVVASVATPSDNGCTRQESVVAIPGVNAPIPVPANPFPDTSLWLFTTGTDSEGDFFPADTDVHGEDF